MTYAKQIDGGRVVSILTYDYEPDFGDDPNTIIITEEEYNALMEEMIAALPKPDPDAISDSEALKIIIEGEE